MLLIVSLMFMCGTDGGGGRDGPTIVCIHFSAVRSQISASCGTGFIIRVLSRYLALELTGKGRK